MGQDMFLPLLIRILEIFHQCCTCKYELVELVEYISDVDMYSKCTYITIPLHSQVYRGK